MTKMTEQEIVDRVTRRLTGSDEFVSHCAVAGRYVVNLGSSAIRFYPNDTVYYQYDIRRSVGGLDSCIQMTFRERDGGSYLFNAADNSARACGSFIIPNEVTLSNIGIMCTDNSALITNIIISRNGHGPR